MKRLCLFLLFLTVIACEKIPENPVWGIVNLRLDLNNRDKVLRGIPSYKTFSLSKPGIDYNPQLNERIGMGGLLVVHTSFDTWIAFDLACPNEQTPNRNTIVEVDEDGINAVCSHCGTKYQIMDGTGINLDGKKFGLRSYPVTMSSGSTRIVTN